MNRPLFLASVTASLALFAAEPAAPAAAPPAAPAPAPAVPASPPPLVWQTIETAEFKVEVPGAAKLQEGSEQTAAGAVKTTTWAIQTADAFYAVSAADYPANVLEATLPVKVLEGARDGAMANVGGTVERDNTVLLDSNNPKKKYPGRDFDGTTRAGLKMAARLFLVDDRLYQLICVSPKDLFNAADFKRLADSFKLKFAAPTKTGPKTKKK